MKKWIDIYRFLIGRELIVLGIALMPTGRAKRELTQMLEDWTAHVRQTILAKSKVAP